MQVEYNVTFEDYIALERFAEERRNRQSVVGRLITWIGYLGMFFGIAIYVVVFFVNPDSRIFFTVVVAVTVLLAYAGKAARQRQLESVRQQLQEKPAFFRITVTPHCLRLENPQSKGEFDWSLVSEFAEQDAYLFIVCADQAVAIPRQAFPDYAARARFIETFEAYRLRGTDAPPKFT
jgi:hypothetical protein